jgi:M6 family metalloprotease-like protein
MKKQLLFILIIFSFIECSKSPNTTTQTIPTSNSTPTITSFTPTVGNNGTSVVITGTNLTNTTSVYFGGVQASSYNVASATSVFATVGSGASGEVKLITTTGTATLAGFTYNNTLPTISSFLPTTATTTNLVTIKGTNFIGTTSVSFGGSSAASFTIVDANTITAIVGAGSSGDIMITNASGSSTFAGFNYSNSYVPCKLPDLAGRADVGIGFPRKTYRTNPIGNIKVTVIFVDFSDAPATRTPQDVFSKSISPASENYFNAVSYGNLKLNFDPQYQWIRMSKPSNGYGWSALTFALHKAYIQEAINLADPNVDFSKSDAFLIVSNPDAGAITNGPAFTATPGNGITVDGITINNGATSGRDLTAWNGLWLPHEFGHTLTLADLYAFTGVGHRFVGEFSLMGLISGTAPEFLGWERWLLGWINDNQVICSNSLTSGKITLTPIEKKDGIKLLVIPLDGSTAIVVESRRNLGYDIGIPKSGPLVYLIDTKLPSGNGSIKVLPIDDTDIKKLQLPLSVGQTLTYNNVTIKLLSTDINGDAIQYEKK